MTEKKKITGDMIIGDILAEYPELHAIFMDWGLHCAMCHIGAFESLVEGTLAHGFSDDEIETFISELNEELSNIDNENI